MNKRRLRRIFRPDGRALIGDRDRLSQVFSNLLDNAIKYSNSEAVIEVHAAGEGAELVIQVKDHGCGIEAQHLPRLFERFYRVDKARSSAVTCASSRSSCRCNSERSDRVATQGKRTPGARKPGAG